MKQYRKKDLLRNYLLRIHFQLGSQNQRMIQLSIKAGISFRINY
jgi:hypothetical protein